MGLTVWIIISACTILTPLLFLILCPILYKLGRGYNSLGRAMASAEAQAFASRMFAKIMFRLNIPMLIITIIGIIIGFMNVDNIVLTTTLTWILLGLPLLVLIPVVIRVEILLRRFFDKNGRPFR